ncbi:MAG: serine dehydratase [Spirochaetae bacterium HGW-Spirochaetae-3]|jgi:L-serine dehydratase|nr:MAG: serine dehydratase [Spirochaetae bacterium HGW-Spirochaetae-3]
METIKDIYRIGFGPSSSHTMGPRAAAERFSEDNPASSSFRATLFGSLAATGRGHLTDVALAAAFDPRPLVVEWRPDVVKPFHTNAMTLEALSSDGTATATRTVYSVGGGKVVEEGAPADAAAPVYGLTTMRDILDRLHRTGQTFWEYVEECEGAGIWEYLGDVWAVMKAAVERGIEAEGVLPGGLKLPRKASSYFVRAQGFRGSLKRRSMLYAFALAVAEENAAGGRVVTAPTCGSCGVLPGMMYGMATQRGFSEAKILRSLATAGLVGNLVKKNASISGAQVGCQGEIGTACAMASAAAAQLFGGTPNQIEYAAEMGLEHHLGLTCDPVRGLVQIPCIERNAFAASRALDANTYALLSDGRHRIGFDTIVETMNRTGNDLPKIYKETSEGGLAIFAPCD